MIAARFGTGRRFTGAYLDYFRSAQRLALASQEELDRLDDTQRGWLDYALSTNYRGADLLHYVNRYRTVRASRYLDIGSGFGGCLIAARRLGATACAGIEVDPLCIELSRKNLVDFEVDAPVYELDAFTPQLDDLLGTFDVITCTGLAGPLPAQETPHS